jgi:hypothetical protein
MPSNSNAGQTRRAHRVAEGKTNKKKRADIWANRRQRSVIDTNLYSHIVRNHPESYVLYLMRKNNKKIRERKTISSEGCVYHIPSRVNDF